jgi:hypothetical protein
MSERGTKVQRASKASSSKEWVNYVPGRLAASLHLFIFQFLIRIINKYGISQNYILGLSF